MQSQGTIDACVTCVTCNNPVSTYLMYDILCRKKPQIFQKRPTVCQKRPGTSRTSEE